MVKLSLLFAMSLLMADIALADGSASKSQDTFTAIMSTKHDFGETNINGQMRAPDGFFLRGRETQRMSQMVRLRSNFNRNVRNSRSGIKATHR